MKIDMSIDSKLTSTPFFEISMSRNNSDTFKFPILDIVDKNNTRDFGIKLEVKG